MRRGGLHTAVRVAGRLAVAGLLVGAVWDPRLPWGQAPLDLVLAVDDSISMPAGFADQAWARVAEVSGHLPTGSRLGLVRFAAQALVERAPAPLDPNEATRRPAAGAPPTAATGSNLEAGLEAALRLLAPGRRGAVVVASDGGETDGNVRRPLEVARSAGIPVYGLAPTQATAGHPARILDLRLPARARLGEGVPVTVLAASASGARATVALTLDGQPGPAQGLGPPPGEPFAARLKVRPGRAGVLTLEATLGPVDPTSGPLDRRVALLNVDGPGAVLYLTPHRGVRPVHAALAAGGWEVERVTPEGFLARGSRLAERALLVLDDVAAGDLPDHAWALVAEAVRLQGLGLVVLGGPGSFAAGGYRGSRLEGLLPLTAEAPDTLPRAAVLFVLDKSGSMGRAEGGPSRFATARRAVAETAASLLEGDLSGLVLFDARAELVLPLASHLDPAGALGEAAAVRASGGTQLEGPLELAVDRLAEAPADQRILLLVTDGLVPGAPSAELEARLAAARIEVVALAVGPDAELGVLTGLAARHGGTVLRVAELAQLPRLMRGEIERRRAAVELGEVQPRPSAPIPFLPAGARAWPRLTGYAVTRARPTAAVYLRSDRGDPLLAAHHAGTGRVVALPAGLAGWAADWPAWPGWGAFVGGLAAWASASAGSPRLEVQVATAPGALRYVVDAATAPREWASTDEARVVVRDPTGQTREAALTPVAPGRYEASVPAPFAGAYLARVEVGGDRLLHGTFHDAGDELAAAKRGETNLQRWRDQGLLRAWPGAGALEASPATAGHGARAALAVLAVVVYVLLIAWEHGVLRRAWAALTARTGTT